MSCLKNQKAEDNFTELSQIFNSQTTASSLIALNNGFSLEENRYGNDSRLFKQLMLVTKDRKKALTIKATIYKGTFENEPDISEILPLDQRTPTSFGYTISSMRRAVFKDTVAMAIKMGKDEKVKKTIQPDVIESTNPTKTANIINFYYKQDIAFVENNVVVIKPSDVQLKQMVKNQVEREYKQIELEALENVKKQSEENNNPVLEPYDGYSDYNDYDLSEYSDSTKTTRPTDFLNFQKFRDVYIEKLEKRLEILRSKKRLVKDRELAKQVIRDIVEVSTEIKKLQADKARLGSELDVVANIQRMANSDLRRAERLIKSDNGEDILQAKDIIDWYMLLGEFIEPTNHPFFGNNITYDNQEVKDKLIAIGNLAKKLNVQLDEKVRKATYQQLVTHRNYEKLGLTMTIGELFNTETPDIDIISAWALNPNFTFDFTKDSSGDNLISQLMVEHFVGILSVKDGFAKNMVESIDAITTEVEKKLKGDYSIFYQKNEDGNLTPYLIDAFSSAWFKLRGNIQRRVGRDITNLINQGSNDFTSAYRNKYKSIKKHANFLQIDKLPAIKQAFEGRIRTTFASDTDSQQYERELIDRLGKNEYNRIIAEQVKLIDEYLIKTKIFIDGLLASEQLTNPANLSQASKRKIVAQDLQDNPFLVKNANDQGQITKTINGIEVSATVGTEYIDYIPKELDTFGLMNSEFDQIKNDDILYEFWNTISDSLRYINNVLVSTGQQQITFNSLLEMNKSVSEDILFKAKMPFKNRLKSIYNKIRDKYVKTTTTGDNEFVKKDDNETSIDSSRLKSLRGKISSISSIDIEVAKKIIGVKDIKPNIRVVLGTNQRLVDYLSKLLSPELMSRLVDNQVRLTYGDITRAIYDQAEKQVMEQQSLDLPKMIKHYLIQAARIDASNETIPTLRIMKSLYKDLQTNKGDLRKHANERIDKWYNRVVRGYYGVKGKPTKQKRLTRAEKIKLEKLKILLDYAVDINDQAKIQERIDQLGNHVNIMWVVSAFQSFIITWAMAYNIKSGVINRFHGYYQNNYFDNLGTYWTPGNDRHTSAFVLGKGRKSFYKLGKKLGTADVLNWTNKAKQMSNAVLFMNKVGIIQDVRNEKQKASRKLGKETFGKKLSPFYVSITGVEWRNQSQTILNVLMDETLTDNQGNVTPIFDGKNFTIYDNVNVKGIKVDEKYVEGGKTKISKGGKLVLKPEFKYNADGSENTKNIENWEKMTGGDFTAFKINAGNAVVAVHGDYSNTGGMAIKDSTLGKLSTTFLTFLPMLLHGRFGAGINLSAGTKRDKSVYKSMSASTMGLAAAVVGGSVFLPLAPVLGGIAYSLKKKFETPPDVGYAKELLVTLKAFAFASMNIPIRIVSGKTPLKIDIGKELKLNNEDAAAARAVSFELAFIMQMIMMKVLAKSILHCENDTEICKKKKALKNWLANNLEMIISELLLPMNPLVVFETVTTGGAFLRILSRAAVWLQTATVALYDTASGDDIDVISAGEFAGQSKLARETRKLFLPSIAKAVGVYDPPTGTQQEYKNVLATALGDDIVDRLLKSDELKVEEYIDKQRTKLRAKLREGDKDDKVINRIVNKKYPTLKQIKRKYKRDNPATAKIKYNRYVEKMMEEL